MSAGDLITADHQYEYNGLLIGSGTNYLCESWDGLFDAAPNLNSNDVNRADGDGVIPGSDLAGGRTIQCTSIQAWDDSDRTAVWTLYRNLATAFQRRTNTELPFSFRHPITGGQIWQINCRPRKLSAPKDALVVMGRAVVGLQLFASRAEFFNRATTTEDISLAAADANKASTFNVPGNYPCGPVITVTGALAANSTIAITGQTTLDGVNYSGLIFTLGTGMAPGDTLVIDFKNKVVTINGVVNYAYKLNTSDWWKLLPGNNTVTVTRAGAPGAAVGVSLAYNECWLI